jgi:DNA-directed RNA polymerase I, II, and III subunit RPABC2
MNTSILQKFEKVRILGQRATQISLGAPPMVDITGLTDALAIAEKELLERKIPLKIIRTFPNGETKEYTLSELDY